jgi:hypothetical protein
VSTFTQGCCVFVSLGGHFFAFGPFFALGTLKKPAFHSWLCAFWNSSLDDKAQCVFRFRPVIFAMPIGIRGLGLHPMPASDAIGGCAMLPALSKAIV